MKIGFDLDGVIANQNTTDLLVIKDKGNFEWEKIYYETRVPLINPYMFASENDEMVIITGRKKELEDITKRWCSKFFPDIPLILAPTPQWDNDNRESWSVFFENVAKSKAELINKLELDIYFEDMVETLNVLRKLCPNTKIIQYGGRLR